MTKRAVHIATSTCLHCHNGFLTVHYPIKIKQSTCASIQTTCCISFKKDTMLHSKLTDISNKYDIPIEQLSDSIQDFPKVSKKMMDKIQQWLELIVTYLYESSSNQEKKSNTLIHTTEKIIQSSSIEYKIRSEIARVFSLPVWRSNKSTGSTSELFGTIHDYIIKNYHLDLSSQVMSQALGFESSYFSKEFKKYNDEGFNGTLKRIRLNQAKLLLKTNPYLSIKQIAKQCGYINPSYFTRIFMESFGISPYQYKKNTSSLASH